MNDARTLFDEVMDFVIRGAASQGGREVTQSLLAGEVTTWVYVSPRHDQITLRRKSAGEAGTTWLVQVEGYRAMQGRSGQVLECGTSGRLAILAAQLRYEIAGQTDAMDAIAQGSRPGLVDSATPPGIWGAISDLVDSGALKINPAAQSWIRLLPETEEGSRHVDLYPGRAHSWLSDFHSNPARTLWPAFDHGSTLGVGLADAASLFWVRSARGMLPADASPRGYEIDRYGSRGLAVELTLSVAADVRERLAEAREDGEDEDEVYEDALISRLGELGFSGAVRLFSDDDRAAVAIGETSPLVVSAIVCGDAGEAQVTLSVERDFSFPRAVDSLPANLGADARKILSEETGAAAFSTLSLTDDEIVAQARSDALLLATVLRSLTGATAGGAFTKKGPTR